VSPGGTVFVLSAPSGTGKTTLCRALLARDPRLELSVSHTTRARRPGEQDGREYHFVSEERFRRDIAAGGFLEHAEYRGHLYGTSRAGVEAALAAGRDPLLEIEVKGARQVREKLPEACLLFVLPPSRSELERRLRGRGTESEEVVLRRIEVAVGEELPEIHRYDWAVVNDDLERATAALARVVSAVRSGDTRALEPVSRPEAVLRRLGGLEGLLAR